MKSVDLKETETGIVVSGSIDFYNVLALRRKGNRVIHHFSQRQLTVDLSELKSSDSSGLSLLLRWLHYAGQRGKTISFINMPEALYEIAKVCGVVSLLGV